MSIEKVLYTAEAWATGGREGVAKSDDGTLRVKLSTPLGALTVQLRPCSSNRTT